MTRNKAIMAILEAKKEKGLTWEDIADAVGGHKVWVASVLLGRDNMNPEDADRIAGLLGLDRETTEILQECPVEESFDDTVPMGQPAYRCH